MKRGKMQIAGRSAGRHYENHSMVVRLLEMRRRESVYILLVQMSPKGLKMQENGDVNV